MAEKEGCADFRGRIAELLPGAPPRRHARDAQIGHACVPDGRCIATMTRHTRIVVMSILILVTTVCKSERLASDAAAAAGVAIEDIGIAKKAWDMSSV